MLAAIDELVEALIDAEGPGVAVAVIKDGVVLHSKGYGYTTLGVALSDYA